jgi:membrane protein HdeD
MFAKTPCRGLFFSSKMISSIPRLDRPVRFVFALCLAAASIVHVNDLWQHGWLPYRFAPLPLNVYWTVLAFLDALAAFLLLVRPRAGLALTFLVIVSDVALNLFARFYLGLRLQTFALSLQVLFFVAVVAAALYARRAGAATEII